MHQSHSADRRHFLKSLAFVLMILVVMDLLLLWHLSDFWQQPMPMTTKMGVVSYEILVLLLCSSTLFCVPYVSVCPT
jgi:hypothetical protein